MPEPVTLKLTRQKIAQVNQQTAACRPTFFFCRAERIVDVKKMFYKFNLQSFVTELCMMWIIQYYALIDIFTLLVKLFHAASYCTAAVLVAPPYLVLCETFLTPNRMKYCSMAITT